MAEKNTNSAIATLLDNGADAMSNMYEVYITFPGNDSGKAMTVRADGFNIPEMDVATYDLEYHGQKVSKPKTVLNFDRKFSLNFRMDAGYQLHKLFLQWQGYVGNPVTGGVANVAGALGEVRVTALNDAYIAQSQQAQSFQDKLNDNGSLKEVDGQTWVFKDVWVNKVGQPQYKTEGGDKFTFAVDFKFGRCTMPGYDEV